MNFSTQIENVKRSETLILIGLLLFILATPIIFFPGSEVEWTDIFSRWKNLAPFIILLLLNHFVLVPVLLFQNQRLIYGLIVLSLITGFGLFRSIEASMDLDFKPPPEFHENRPSPGDFPDRNRRIPPRNTTLPVHLPPFVEAIFLSVLVLVFDTGLRSSFRLAKTEHDNMKLEKENVENRLSMLKNQVSPHFFMNTLNNVHALIDIDPEEAKAAVIKLSKMMRHLLQEPESGLISLKDEITFLNSYIDLMRIRYSEKVDIQVDLSPNYSDVQLPPLLFTSLIENAFKHGISYKDRSFIHIAMEANGNNISFSIKNSNHSKNSPDNTGIGILNTKDRLDLLYKDQYELLIEDNEKEFNVKLNIPI